MKLIYVFTPSLSPSLGGIQNLSYHLFNNLKKRKKIYAFSGDVPKNEKMKDVFYSKNRTSQIKIAKDILIKSFFKSFKEKSDVNIALTWKLGIITYLLKLVFNIPYIVYVHGNDIYIKNKSKFEKHIIKKVLGNSEIIVANSLYTKKLCEYYVNRDIEIIHPGINYKDESETLENINTKKILTICRLEKRKGIETVLRAMPDILDKHKDIQYNIAGKGPYQDELKKIAKELNLESNVNFLGYISEEDKSELYKKCDLFVMPSFEVEEDGSVEGFGIVYLEANMYGKYVIAGRSGGISDAVINNKTGSLVDGKSIDEVKNAIIDFYKENDSRGKRSKECIGWAKKHDWADISLRLNDIIDNIIIKEEGRVSENV